MNKLYRFICLFFLLLVMSCTSTTTETSYYLLVKGIEDQVHYALPQKKRYSINVNLAEYLKKPYIAMQVNENQLHYSLFHLWAEPLEQGIKKLITLELSKLNTSKQNMEKGNQDIYQIDVDIDYFHATDKSKVILAGKFQTSFESRKINKPFYLEAKLDKNGFSHAITKMSTLVAQLSTQISYEL